MAVLISRLTRAPQAQQQALLIFLSYFLFSLVDPDKLNYILTGGSQKKKKIKHKNRRIQRRIPVQKLNYILTGGSQKIQNQKVEDGGFDPPACRLRTDRSTE